MVNTIVFVKV